MRSKDALPLAALIAAAALIRFATIDVQSLWADEALTSSLVRAPFFHMLGRLPHDELTPPLYYVVAWPWVRVFGHLEVGLRSFSAVCGIATVPVVYLIARELASRRIALVFAALTAFNPLLVWYSQEGRPYSMLVLLSGLATLFFVRALERRTTRELVLWTVLAVLALLTHYFAAFLVVPQALRLVWVWRPRARALIAAGVLGAVGIALIPLAAREHSNISTDYISVVPFRNRAIGVPEDFLTGFVIKWYTAKENAFYAVTFALAALGAVLAFARTDLRERRALRYALVGVATAIVVPALLARAGVDFLNSRNVIAGWLPAFAVLAIGFGAARAPRALTVAAVAALCAIGVATTTVVASDTDMQRSDFRGAAHALGGTRTTRLVTVPVIAGQVAFGEYLTRLEPMPPGGSRVSEFVVVTPRNPRLGGPGVSRPARPVPPTPRFRLVERRYAATWSLVRFRAPTPQLVTVPDVVRAGVPLMPAPQPLLQLAGSAPR